MIRLATSFLSDAITGAGYTCELLARTFGTLHRFFRRIRSITDQFYLCGVKPLPVVMIVAVFTGILLAYQTGLELDRFGQREKIADIIGIVLCREMGPFITALILTASVGAAMAAELGTMTVSEEIDAMECMSIDPVDFLVMPRLVALALMCPLLTFVTDIVGIVGGGFISQSQLQIPWHLYLRAVQESLTRPFDSVPLPKEIFVGLAKAFVYGVTIAIVGCSYGLRTTNGALGVGRQTRGAVVTCFMLVIIFGYFMTWAFYP
jgi:phospholipid/cholesterol/gamma-HCH transport system permease protein